MLKAHIGLKILEQICCFTFFSDHIFCLYLPEIICSLFVLYEKITLTEKIINTQARLINHIRILFQSLQCILVIANVSVRMFALHRFNIDNVLSLENSTHLIFYCLTDSKTVHLTIEFIIYLFIYAIFVMDMPPCDMWICRKLYKERLG